jgi:uncharacterized membrane protein YdbT with pleckstrin-like domain
MPKRVFQVKVKASRNSYFLVYLMILSIIGAIIYLMTQGIQIEKWILISSVVFILFLIKIIEIHRHRDWWALTDTVLYESKSILNKNIREIDYSAIASLELDQPLYKRFLNYGTVIVRMRLNGAPVYINNIKSPEDFLRRDQKIIFEKRRKNEEK